MGKKSFIFVAALLLVLIAGAVSVYAYDSSNERRIAEGITVAGVPVGGLELDAARARVDREVAAPLERPVVVSHGQKRFTLLPQDAEIRTDVGGMVNEALEASRDGNILSRTLRDLGGGEESMRVDTRVSYSKPAAAELVKRVRKSVDRPAKDATLDFPALTKVKEEDGVEVRNSRLRAEVDKAITQTDDRDVAVPTKVLKPEVTRADLADKYPALLVIERGSFKLRFYRNLNLQKEYTIAVGQVGLETPAGLYQIENKAVDPAWSVPNSAWAGSLAGTVVPGGTPQNPLKARWLGIYAGAGIHGTDDVASLGTAASHGCVRMAIPDVIELYDQVDVQTPVYVA